MDNTLAEFGEWRQRVLSNEKDVAELRSEMRASFSALNTKLDERAAQSRPQFTAITSSIGVAVLLISSLGWLALEPLKGRLASMENALAMNLVPRPEHIERWRANEKDLENFRQRLDELRKDYTSVWGQRDLLQDLRDRLYRLEQEKKG
jgi:hypothetical protein